MMAARHDAVMDDLAVGRLLRTVRVRRGWRQEDLARAAGVSRQTVSRVELGRLEGVPLGSLRRVFEAVDVRVIVAARGVRAELPRVAGEHHAAMHEDMARLFGTFDDWAAVPEVTFSVFGERGSVDILAWHARSRSLLVIELKTELVDLQETVSTLDRKVRLAMKIARGRGWEPASVSTWLVIAEARHNRRAVEQHAHVVVHAREGFAQLAGGGRYRPGFLHPAFRAAHRHHVHEFSAADVIDHDMAERTHPDGHVGRHEASRKHLDRRERAPAHRAGEARRLLPMQRAPHQRMDAVASDHEVGLLLASVLQHDDGAIVRLRHGSDRRAEPERNIGQDRRERFQEIGTVDLIIGRAVSLLGALHRRAAQFAAAVPVAHDNGLRLEAEPVEFVAEPERAQHPG